MKFTPSARLSELSNYPFAEINDKVAELKSQGIDVIDFGAGDPTEPTPLLVRAAVKKGVDAHADAGYPSYVGAAEFRKAIAAWTGRRFEVKLDPENEICASIGSKEAIFNFHEAVVNPGDIVIVPNPGYPPYSRGARFAEGRVHYVDLLPERGFLPDLDSIPKDVCEKAKILWLNYPNNPSGVVAPLEFYRKAVEFGKKNDIIIASDEAYSENYFGLPPRSLLEVAKDGCVVFQSLSKRSCMTGYRVGWVAGDPKLIDAFKKLKTNIDSGTPNFIQDAAIAALSDEKHVEELRRLYKKKRDIIVDALVACGLPECRPEATLYVWQRLPEGTGSVEFAKRLLEPGIAIVATPGSWISEPTQQRNPGEGFVRFALVPTLEQCEEAAERLGRFVIPACF